MPWVADASVAFKWFIPESGSDAALALLDGDDPIWAPDLILVEVSNALWVRLRQVTDGRKIVAAALDRLGAAITSLEPARELVARAQQIAFEIEHPVYDCVYLALAERENLYLITADARLLRAVSGSPFQTLARSLA